MTSPFKVVAVSGGTYRPSRTLVLTQALIAELGQSLPIDSRVIELTDIAAPLGATPARNQAPAELQAVLDEIEAPTCCWSPRRSTVAPIRACSSTCST